ncbi:dihydrolipoyl dehydrogenase [Thermovenabulum sp.]|uniref:dihydrolipoyl dehydrogenase n=1 Tax=Thermovenabulum sp. TaxID=3100335 RepID=UPI003C7E02D8
MAMHYDVAIIGGGPGGYVAAIYLRKKNKKVALIEKGELGGTCLNKGCIPTKVLSHSAEFYSSIRKARNFGIEVESASLNWEMLMKYKEKVIKTLQKGVENLLKANGVNVYRGEAVLESEKEVKILFSDREQIITADSIILACGSKPLKPPIPGIDSQGVLTSEEILNLRELPSSIAIIGGGVIGLEMAFIFNSFGVKTTVIEMQDRLIPNFDREISEEIKKHMQRAGINIYVNSKVTKIEENSSGLKVMVESEKEIREYAVEKILVSVGRKPDFSSVVKLHIEKSEKGILVNERMQTNIKNVYAIGDIVGKYQLAHVASHEGIVASKNILGENEKMDYKAIPFCVYSHPEIASVGMSEDEAKRIYGEIKVGKFPFIANGRALTLGENSGFVKIISEPKYNEILGIHMIGPNVTELISEAVLAIKLECTAEELVNTVHAHPTLSEVTMESAFDLLGIPIHKIN